MSPAQTLALAETMPPPLADGDMLAAIDAGGAWDSVQMTDRRMVEGEDCIVLGYAAVARRADSSSPPPGSWPHRSALCSNLLRRRAG